MDNQQFSPGSTISGIFEPNLKTPDPFQFVYISHPFGAPALTPTTPSDFYESSFEIIEFNASKLSQQNSKMNFNCNFMDEIHKCRPEVDCYYKPREFYDMKTTFYPSPSISNSCTPNYNQKHHTINNNMKFECDSQHNNSRSYLQRHIPSQEDLQSKINPSQRQHPSVYNCYDERTVPEIKFIFETLRNVWKTPMPIGKNPRENKCKKFCCQNLPHKRNGYNNNCEGYTGTNVTPNTRSSLIRRYSLPEIEIRKFGVVQEIDSILRYSRQLQQNLTKKLIQSKPKKCNIMKTMEKSSQTIPVTIIEKIESPNRFIDHLKPNLVRQSVVEFSDNGLSYLDLVNNRRDIRPKIVKKPESMPEKECNISNSNHKNYQLTNSFQNSIPSTIKSEKNDNILMKIPSETLQPKIVQYGNNMGNDIIDVSVKSETESNDQERKTKNPVNPDNYISELLIKNLNEEIHIADILMKGITEPIEPLLPMKPSLPLTPKIEISTIYVSPQKMNEIVSRSSSVEKQEQQIFKQTLQLPDLCLSNAFEKLPPLGGKLSIPLKNDTTNSLKDENVTLSLSTNNDGEKIIGLPSKNISESSSLTFEDTFDTPTLKSFDDSPIDSLEHSKKLVTSSVDKSTSKSSIKNEFSRKPNNIAEIQPINKPFPEESKINKISAKTSSNQPPASSKPEKRLVLSQRKKLNRPKVNDNKDTIDSLAQYTVDSKGNLNYQKPSPGIINQRRNRCPKQSASGINSRYLRVSASSTTSRQSTHQNDKLKKVTIFEAQSNMVTPDNDMGPKRFYQKTEIFDGDKKIDILEIVECLQSPFACEAKTPGDFYTKFSKIPIPIKKCCRSIQATSMNSCSGHFKCCSSNIMKEPFMSNSINQFNSTNSIEEPKDEQIFFQDYVLPISFKKPEELPTKSSIKVTPFKDKIEEKLNTNEAHREPYQNDSLIKFKESGVSGLNTIDDSSKSTNINDGTSTTNDAYTISIPSTMTANHGSTPRRKSSSKYKFYSTKSSSKSGHVPNIVHCRAKKLKNSGKYEKRLLSHRKQQHDIINVKPTKCNQTMESSRFKRSSTQAGLSLNDDKLNAWRIPSSDFYTCTKDLPTNEKFSIKPNEYNLSKFPRTSTDLKLKDKCTPSSKCQSESIVSTTTICEKCRLCSCYTSTTFSDRLLYSPTLSICSVCSQPFTPLYQSPATPANECYNANCNHSTTLKKDYNFSDEFGCRNKTCLPLPLTTASPLKTNNNCSKGNNCNCPAGSKLPKVISNECPPIPEKYCGFMQNTTPNICKGNDQPLDRFLTSSSSFTSSIWKSARSHTAMPCINWKAVLDNKKKPEIKIEPVKLTIPDDKKSNNSVFTVTVKGPTLEKGTDLKMELCFSNPNKDNGKSLTDTGNDTDDISTCSLETIHERMLPEGPSNNTCNSHKIKGTLETSNHLNDQLDSEYHLNLSNILNHKTALNQNNTNTGTSNNLSVLGNAIAPEQKPKAPTMTEKDLTGRYRK